jgi:hypothetical protein
MNGATTGRFRVARAIVFRQHPYHVLVDVDAERLRVDVPSAGESRFRDELDDGLDRASLGPFGPAFFEHDFDENRRRYLRRTNA